MEQQISKSTPMKKIFLYIGILVLGLVLVVIALIAYVKIAMPDVGPAEVLTVESTPERIERGKYLATNLMVCMDCHSTRDWSKFSGPLKEGTLGQGGEKFDRNVGMPGVILSRNITPAGVQRYTDGELFRLITTGVTKEGRAMFPLMPYQSYGRMDREDIYSVIAFIRSLEPIENPVPDTELDFPLSVIINTIPTKAVLTQRPDRSDKVSYGGYLVNAAACLECHTQAENGQIIPEFAFGGGREFKFPDGSIVRSMNITPHKTGIGAWSEEMFVRRFKMYTDSTFTLPSVAPGEFNSYMPWTMYARLDEEDLKAIYAYLQTVKPIESTVERFTSANTK
jgi:hypothetical protein